MRDKAKQGGSGLSMKTVLLALPSIYLVVALVFMGGGRGVAAPAAPSIALPRVLYIPGTSQGGAPPPAAAPPASAPAADTGGDGPTPPKPAGPTEEITFYDGNKVQTYPFATEGTGAETWWHNIARGWEEDSLYAIRAMLLKKPGATYIDFGSWIGPTVLFASPYAARVYALEPDPVAYTNVYWNVKANPHIAAKVTVRNLCISNNTNPITMWGTPGDSMSTIKSVADSSVSKDKNLQEWEVQCTTLDQFVKDNGIDPNKLVLKVDTEGAERDILIQLAPWIAQYKPSMLLSFHAFRYPDDHAAHKKLKDIISQYKTALLPRGETFEWSAFSVGGWCRLCAMVLSDDVISPDEVKPVKKTK